MSTYAPSAAEWLANCLVGFLRFVLSIVKRRNALDTGELPGRRSAYDRIVSEMNGANGEHALCDHLGEPFDTNPLKSGGPDVVHDGIRYEVRATPLPDGRLPIKPADDVDVWVLVIVEPTPVPSFRIAGCCTARQGKRPEYLGSWRDGYHLTTEAWHWVPQHALVELPVGGPSRGLAELNGVTA